MTLTFVDRAEGKYPSVLYDWEAREVIDLVRSRQKAWLEGWFEKKSRTELDNVRWFVSDMYDEYARVKRKFLPNATHVVDLFHVVKLLSEAVKKLRTDAMNAVGKGTFEYAFMKARWRLFQMPFGRVPARSYTYQGTGECVDYHDALIRCLHSHPPLWDGWAILQELLRWNSNADFDSAIAFVERISNRLIGTGNPRLEAVGRSYHHWRVEIANGFARTQSGRRFSNGVAEGLNNRIKTLKKISNGCLNFDRFRKRVLLILTYSPKE